MTGDIHAEIALWGEPTGIVVKWLVARNTNAGGATTVLASGDFNTQINTGVAYNLHIAYDSTANQFTFKIGDEEKTCGLSDGLPPWVRNANSPWKALTTRVQIDNHYSSAYISASFDNVVAKDASDNILISDNFSSPTINSANWTSYESVREISGGKLRSKFRSGPGYTSSVYYNRLEFVNPSTSNVIQAKVTPLSYQNSQGVDVQARIGGNFYQDGSSGGGYIGVVGASVWIGGTGEDPVAGWYVWRYTDLAGNIPEFVDSGTFATSITLGSTYTLFLGWDGSQLTMKCGGEIITYTPVPPILPFDETWKEIGNRIMTPAGKEALIEALFDDVMNEWDYIPLKGLSREGMGLAAWDQGHDVPACISNTGGHANYYGATRDFVDPGTNGLKGTGTLYGFTNFAAALSAAGYTINDIAIKFGKVSLGNDTPGVDWDVYGDTETRYYYTEGDDNPLTIYVGGTPILQESSIKLTVRIDNNNPANNADDIVGGYTTWFVPTDITVGTSTPQPIKNIASAFLDDLNGRAVRIEFPSLTTSGDFMYDGKSGKYLDVPNAKLALDPDGIYSFFGARLAPAFKNEDLVLAGTLFSDSYLNYGETKNDILNGLKNEVFASYNSIRANVTKINYQIYQDMADVTWSWIVTGRDGSNNTILIWREEVEMVFRKGNGNWVIYGNQEKYDIGAGSVNLGTNFYSAFSVDDPGHAITSVTVTGTGIDGALSLEPMDGEWSSFGSIDYGTNPPSNASYTITIVDGSGTHTYNRIVDGGVTGFATNLSPSGNVYGNPTFTFTGLARDGVEYNVGVFDSNGNGIWYSDVPQQPINFCPYTLSIDYSGPPLSPGSTYNYYVRCKIGENSSIAAGQFTYSGNAGTLSVTPQEDLSVSGLPGGPFNPSSKIYTLSNPGGVSIDWTASKTQGWVDLSQSSGTLSPGASTDVTVSINNNANSLAAGTYADAVTFTNATNGSGNTARNVTLSVQVQGGLSVTSVEDLNSSGFEGGPFTPLSKDYTLTNTGAGPISWSVTKTKTWVKVSKTGGTLAAGATALVTVSVVSNSAKMLDAGAISDTITFTNKTNGVGTTARKINRLVNAINTSLSSPSNVENYGVCSYYPAFGPPTFRWDINGGTLKSLELQFYAENNPSKILKVKATATELAQKGLQVKASIWKSILLLPGTGGGEVNWKTVGTKQNNKKVESNMRSFFVAAPEAVGSPQIDPTSKASVPTLSWTNNCNSKFKTWFYNDPEYYSNPAKTGVKKTSLSFTDTNPNDNSGSFTKGLTSGQWTAIQTVVGKASGSKIYWHVESSDVVSTSRLAKTPRQEFTLQD